MNRLYARFVYGWIRPGLDLRAEPADMAVLQAEAIEQIIRKRISVELKSCGVLWGVAQAKADRRVDASEAVMSRRA